MAKKGGRQDQPYNFAEAFERAVVYLACTNPRFLSRTAHEIRADLLSIPACRHALESAQTIHRDTGRGPGSAVATIQRTARRRDDGKLTEEEVRAVVGLFDQYDGTSPPAVEDIEPELVIALKNRLRFAVAEATVGEHNTESWEKTDELRRREQLLGKADQGIGYTMTPEVALRVISESRNRVRVPFGIDVLDEGLFGGVPRGTLTGFLAGPGGAKSMLMSHIAGQATLRGLHALYATLELPVEQVMARVLANQTGITIDEILTGAVKTAPQLPKDVLPPTIQEFAPQVTTPEVIIGWVRDVEKISGRKPDVLLVDYADKMSASGKQSEKGMYQEMMLVYERLRYFCAEEGIVGVTASQSRGREEKKKGKLLDMQDTADSMHKPRVLDQYISINVDDESKEVTFFIIKNRYGDSRKVLASVPSTFATGQVAPIGRERGGSPF